MTVGREGKEEGRDVGRKKLERGALRRMESNGSRGMWVKMQTEGGP